MHLIPQVISLRTATISPCNEVNFHFVTWFFHVIAMALRFSAQFCNEVTACFGYKIYPAFATVTAHFVTCNEVDGNTNVNFVSEDERRWCTRRTRTETETENGMCIIYKGAPGDRGRRLRRRTACAKSEI